jgi:hypothetical protein
MTPSQANKFMAALRAGQTLRRITGGGKKLGPAIASRKQFRTHCTLYPEWGAEPSLGSHELPSGAISYQQSISFGEVDVEGEHDGREPDVDSEPSLGSSNDHHGNGTSYINWADIVDAEGHDDDFEPSLGWTEQMGQGNGGQWGGSAITKTADRPTRPRRATAMSLRG